MGTKDLSLNPDPSPLRYSGLSGITVMNEFMRKCRGWSLSCRGPDPPKEINNTPTIIDQFLDNISKRAG